MTDDVFDQAAAPPRDLEIPTRQQVADQGIEVPTRWWRERLPAQHLPDLLRGGDGGGDDRRVVTRSQVWALADGVTSDGGASRLLWASIAWGAGSRLRLCKKRIAAAAAVSDLERALTEVALVSREDPAVAYSRLHSRGGAAVRYLGPAFGTKFLYFAGGGRVDHRSSILDSRVATALAPSWGGLSARGGWSVHTYRTYCDQLQRWTAESGLEAADQLELALFRSGGSGGTPITR